MRPVLITVFDSETGTNTEYSFTASPVRIGRNPLNDLALPFPFVSGWHAVVRFDETVAKFFDLGSTNGTLLNGRRIDPGEAVMITEMLSVTIGKLELRFHRDAQAPTVAPEPIAAAVQMGQYAQQPNVAGTINPPVRGPSPGEGTAHIQMGDVHQTVNRLRPLYDAYRHAWGALHTELRSAFDAMPDPMKGFSLTILRREFPNLDGESDFAALSAQAGAPVPDAATGGGAGGDAAAVRKLAQSLRPDEEAPRTREEIERFLSCVEDVLRASAKAFVELQRGQEQFGNEMGVRTIKEFTALHAAGTPENVLKYLLDWQAGGPHRTQELVGVYADLMIHQVALINGVMEGVRSLLARLDPREVERGISASWPTRAATTWRAYQARYQEITGNDKRITELVFGAEFARAYAEVGGEGSGTR